MKKTNSFFSFIGAERKARAERREERHQEGKNATTGRGGENRRRRGCKTEIRKEPDQARMGVPVLAIKEKRGGCTCCLCI